MAIISCPCCQKQISDKSKICTHCDTDINNMSSEALVSKRRISKINKNMSIQVQTFVALMLFVGGFTLWYWDDVPGESWSRFGGQGMIAIGFIWYMVNRVRLIILKRSWSK